MIFLQHFPAIADPAIFTAAITPRGGEHHLLMPTSHPAAAAAFRPFSSEVLNLKENRIRQMPHKRLVDMNKC